MHWCNEIDNDQTINNSRKIVAILFMHQYEVVEKDTAKNIFSGVLIQSTQGWEGVNSLLTTLNHTSFTPWNLCIFIQNTKSPIYFCQTH